MDLFLLFIWCFAASSIIPLSSEAYYASIIVFSKVWIMPLLVASIANTLGSITTFWIGKKTADYTLTKLSSKHIKRYNKAQQMLNKYGPFALILAWVPIIGDILVALAGALHFSFIQSTLWIAIGKTARYAIIAAIVLQY